MNSLVTNKIPTTLYSSFDKKSKPITLSHTLNA